LRTVAWAEPGTSSGSPVVRRSSVTAVVVLLEVV